MCIFQINERKFTFVLLAHVLLSTRLLFFCFEFKWLPKPHSLKHTLDISASHVIASYISVLLLHKTTHHCSAPS